MMLLGFLMQICWYDPCEKIKTNHAVFDKLQM